MFLLFQTGRVNSYSASSEFQEDWVRRAHTHLPKRVGASLGRAPSGTDSTFLPQARERTKRYRSRVRMASVRVCIWLAPANDAIFAAQDVRP